jgi:hypothetical protein
LGGRSPATIGRRPHVASDEGGLNCLFTRSQSSCDVEKLLDGFRLFVAELVNQGVARRAVPKRRDDIGIGDTRKLVALL